MIQSEYLTFQAALFTSLVLICLDWGNSLLSDILDYIFHKVQKLQNCGAPKVSLLYWKHWDCFPFPSGEITVYLYHSLCELLFIYIISHITPFHLSDIYSMVLSGVCVPHLILKFDDFLLQKENSGTDLFLFWPYSLEQLRGFCSTFNLFVMDKWMKMFGSKGVNCIGRVKYCRPLQIHKPIFSNMYIIPNDEFTLLVWMYEMCSGSGGWSLRSV